MYICIYNIYLYMYRGTFYQKIFSWGNFWGKFMGRGCCTWSDHFRSDHVKGRWSFINSFSNNLNTVNLVPNHVAIFT